MFYGTVIVKILSWEGKTPLSTCVRRGHFWDIMLCLIQRTQDEASVIAVHPGWSVLTPDSYGCRLKGLVGNKLLWLASLGNLLIA